MQQYPGIIAISENGKYAASVWTSKVLHVWDCETGDLIKTLKLSMIPKKLVFSNDSKYLLIPINNKVNFLSLATLTYEHQHFSTGTVNDLAITKSGEYFVCTGSNNRLEVRSTTSGNLLNTLTGSESVQNFFYSEDDYFIYGSKSNMIYTWSASNGSLIKAIPCSTTYGGFDISPSNKYFLIPRGGILDLISTEKMIKIGSAASSYCENVKFYSDDNYFFTDSRTSIGIWKIGMSNWKKI
jgi:WD40 repeat protein